MVTIGHVIPVVFVCARVSGFAYISDT